MLVSNAGKAGDSDALIIVAHNNIILQLRMPRCLRERVLLHIVVMCSAGGGNPYEQHVISVR